MSGALIGDPKNLEQVERYISEKFDVIRANYRATGDAETSLLAVKSLVNDFCGVPAARSSVQLAKLITFVCDLHLSRAESIDDLEVVRNQAERSVQILLSSTEKGKRITQVLTSANLYFTVALKAQSKKDDTFEILKRAKFDLRRYFDTNFVDEILLTR